MSDNNNSLSTKEKLISTGIRLFAKYGFEATTTRMIADDAGLNLATMSFHFKSKENFYKEVLEYVSLQIAKTYEPIYSKIQSLDDKGNLTEEVAWELIDTLLNLQLSIAVDLPNQEYLMLLYWEQIYRADFMEETPITDVVCIRSESALALLLKRYCLNITDLKASLISRIINGSIVSFGEHPIFIKPFLTQETQSQKQWLKNEILFFIKSSIQHYCKDL